MITTDGSLAGQREPVRPELYSGSEAIARAAILAGCRFFAGYPMPVHRAAREHVEAPGRRRRLHQRRERDRGVNMALGAAATGARAATGSCGQGLALMQEAIAEAALNELPLVVFNMARGQQDYFQATRGGGWGDYRTITLAPKDVPEAVEHTQLLFHLADNYRAPVILYGDYVIAHTHVGIRLEAPTSGRCRPRTGRSTALRGTGRARQIWTWARGKPNDPGPGPDEHWRQIGEKFAGSRDRAALGRARRGRRDRRRRPSARPAVRRLRRRRAARRGHAVGSFRPITLWPFPAAALGRAAAGAHVLVYELNAGQMVDDVRMHARDRSRIAPSAA